MSGSSGGVQYRIMSNKEVKSNQGSRFNQILGNIERSIMSQFNSNTNQGRGKSSTRPVQKSTSAKAIQTSSKTAHDTSRDGSSKCAKSSQTNENPTIGARITAPPQKASVVKSASEKLGKLTLSNSKTQQHQVISSPLHLSPGQNKLPIPPPHAYSESTSQNQTFMFGSGAMQNTLGPDHLPFHNVHRANWNSSISTTHRKDVTSTKMRNDKLFEELHANRLKSSPASSAKSSPAIISKPRSQFDDHTQRTSREDDEDSGFAAYQARRVYNSKDQPNFHHSNQTQSPKSTSQREEQPMMYHLVNNSPHSQQMVHSQNQFVNPNMFDPRSRQNLAFYNIIHSANSNPPPAPHHANLRQYSQSMMSQNCRLPAQDSYNESQLHHFNRANNLNNPMFYHQSELHQPRNIVPIPQTGYIDNQICHSVSNQTNFIDNSQQIYANAPPKPRRYQYYNLTTNQVVEPINQVPDMLPIMPHQQQQQQLHGVRVMRPMTSQHNPYNQRQVLNNQAPYRASISGAPSLYDLNRLRLANINTGAPSNQPHIPNIPSNMRIQRPTQTFQPINIAGFPLMKSKSSLDATDIMRYKQGSQMIRQNDPTKVQALTHTIPPVYGYRHDNYIQPNFNISTMRRTSQEKLEHTFFGGNLQRSKSVTHLLPETNDSVFHNASNLSTQQQLTTLSSASTNQINLIGGNQTIGRSMTQIRAWPQNEHIYPSRNQVMPSTRTSNGYDLKSVNGNYLNQNLISDAFSNQFYRAKSMASLNSELNATIRPMRYQQNKAPYESREPNKPSLGDQIKHLLIDSSENDGAQPLGLRNQDNVAMYQPMEHNRALGLVYTSASSANLAQASASYNNDHAIPVSLAEKHQQPYHMDRSPNSGTNPTVNDIERFTVPRKFSDGRSPESEQSPQPLTSKVQILASSSSLADICESSSSMGNRQQRQYQVQQSGDADLRNHVMTFTRLQPDANSHLIVDLTTPKVLAKTQTTLQPTISSSDRKTDSWSMNQVGLPDMPTTSDTKSPIDSDHTTKTIADKQSQTQTSQLSDDNNNPRSDPNSTGLDRTAPYYYSDLKSEEQRRALMSIVQQKSLSPPPQLLSRSIDQNTTRLTPKSATMHPSHAKNLRDNLAQLQNSRDASISQFSSSQFSASDFNTSTSVSESSNSSSAINGDSLDSLLSCSKNNTGVGHFKTTDEPDMPRTVGILKSSNRRSCDLIYDAERKDEKTDKERRENELAAGGEESKMPKLCDPGSNDESGVESFRNVLGNVIDVDSCSINNLSETTPVTLQQTACLN